jgi:hypothetical protein
MHHALTMLLLIVSSSCTRRVCLHLHSRLVKTFSFFSICFTLTLALTHTYGHRYVTGVGSFYFFVNGNKVSDHVMDPPQTVYSKTVLYSTFDIASMLKPGADTTFGALLGTCVTLRLIHECFGCAHRKLHVASCMSPSVL